MRICKPTNQDLDDAFNRGLPLVGGVAFFIYTIYLVVMSITWGQFFAALMWIGIAVGGVGVFALASWAVIYLFATVTATYRCWSADRKSHLAVSKESV